MIEIKILKGKTNEPIDGTNIEIANKIGRGNWNVHPAFWWDKDNDGIEDDGEQLTGICLVILLYIKINILIGIMEIQVIEMQIIMQMHGKYGDALYEVSIFGNDGAGSWERCDAKFPDSSLPILIRGGRSGLTASGLFASSITNGGDICGFRPVLINSQL